MTRLIALLLLAAPPAAAFVPDPPCALDARGEVLMSFAEPETEVGVWPARHPGDVVSVEWTQPDESLHGWVMICGTGAALRWSVSAAGAGAVWDRLGAMLDGEETHTLGDVGRMIRGLGGQATEGASPGACACDSLGL